MRDELVPRRHVDAVDVGVAHRGRGRREGDLVGSGSARHLDNLFRRRTAHDRVVDNEDVLAGELARHCVELLLDALFALGLPGHDERAADVTVLVKTLAVFDAEFLRHLHGGGPRRVGNRHDDVDVAPGRVVRDRVGEPVAEPQSRLVHRDAVHDRVGPCEVDVLKRARNQPRVRGALLRHHLARGRDEHGLAGRHIAHGLVARGLKHQRLARHHPFVAREARRAATQHEGSNAEGVAKRQQPVPGNKGDRRV